jgi:putative transposase
MPERRFRRCFPGGTPDGLHKIIDTTNKSLLKELLKQLRELTKAFRRFRGQLKDKVTGKRFNADLVGAYNILRVGESSPEIIKDLKLLIIKLCNPVKFKLMEFFYNREKVSRLSLTGAGSSSLRAGLSPFGYRYVVI